MSKAKEVRKRPCQCEHRAHFDKDARTPSGNPAHPYGAKFFDVAEMTTTYGKFFFCSDCEKDCRREDEG